MNSMKKHNPHSKEIAYLFGKQKQVAKKTIEKPQILHHLYVIVLAIASVLFVAIVSLLIYGCFFLLSGCIESLILFLRSIIH